MASHGVRLVDFVEEEPQVLGLVARVAGCVEQKGVLGVRYSEAKGGPDATPGGISQNSHERMPLRQLLRAVEQRVVDQEHFVFASEAIQVGNPSTQRIFKAGPIALTQEQDAERLRSDRRQLRRFRHRLARRFARWPRSAACATAPEVARGRWLAISRIAPP